jgi:twitching motility protein PilT
MFEQFTTQEQRDIFDKEWELDFAHSVPCLAQFRVNVLQQRGVRVTSNTDI